jgi:phosphoglycolate phosphatase
MFDLDGTLADTLTDLTNAANHALALLGRPPHDRDRYRYFVGQGVENLFRAALDTDDVSLIEPAVAAFKKHLAAHQYDHSGPYDGVPELLDELTRRGLRLAVMSNKPDDRTLEMVRTLFGRWSWDAVRGQRDGYPVKPDPTAALEIAAELGIVHADWLYVGDTRADMLTGRAAGFYTVGVTWGFRDETELRDSGADAIIHHPSELLDLL